MVKDCELYPTNKQKITKRKENILLHTVEDGAKEEMIWRQKKKKKSKKNGIPRDLAQRDAQAAGKRGERNMF
jgi:hypothetical protein